MAKKIYLGEEEILTKNSDLTGMTGIPESGGESGSAELTLARFDGKKILFCGDSITEANSRTTKNYHGYLHDWLNISVSNDGKSGTGIVRSYSGFASAVTRLQTWDTTYSTNTPFDAICFMGNMNDGTSGTFGAWDWIYGANDATKGDYTTAVTSNNCETSLVYALRYLCEEVIAHYPKIPFLFVISQPRQQTATKSGDARAGYSTKCWGNDGWFSEWVDVIKEVCGHYSIPVLDLYHGSGLRPWNATNNKEFFSCTSSPNGDGIHPNALGHELMAYKIYEFFKQYI